MAEKLAYQTDPSTAPTLDKTLPFLENRLKLLEEHSKLIRRHLATPPTTEQNRTLHLQIENKLLENLKAESALRQMIAQHLRWIDSNSQAQEILRIKHPTPTNQDPVNHYSQKDPDKNQTTHPANPRADLGPVQIHLEQTWGCQTTS